MKWNFIKHGWRYGALVGFVGAELFIIGLALFYVFFSRSMSGADSDFQSELVMGLQMVGAIVLSGQIIGALPAILIGALLSICASLIAIKFPNTLMWIGGASWGFVYALAMLIIFLMCLWLISGEYKSGFDIGALFEADFIPIWTVVILYLCSGAWAGSKLEGLTRLHYKNNKLSKASA